MLYKLVLYSVCVCVCVILYYYIIVNFISHHSHIEQEMFHFNMFAEIKYPLTWLGIKLRQFKRFMCFWLKNIIKPLFDAGVTWKIYIQALQLKKKDLKSWCNTSEAASDILKSVRFQHAYIQLTVSHMLPKSPGDNLELVLVSFWTLKN